MVQGTLFEDKLRDLLDSWNASRDEIADYKKESNEERKRLKDEYDVIVKAIRMAMKDAGKDIQYVETTDGMRMCIKFDEVLQITEAGEDVDE